MRCPNCGRDITPTNYNFCPWCGHELRVDVKEKEPFNMLDVVQVARLYKPDYILDEHIKPVEEQENNTNRTGISPVYIIDGEE